MKKSIKNKGKKDTSAYSSIQVRTDFLNKLRVLKRDLKLKNYQDVLDNAVNKLGKRIKKSKNA